jgi:integrase/recombinase XerD
VGSVLLRETKNGEYRTVFVGKKTRKAIRAYLRFRNDSFDDKSPLWSKITGECLTYFGLNEIMRRRSKQAGIKKVKLHSFRRAFVTNAVRSGMDIESLRKLVGHKDYQVIQRYLKLNTDDIRLAHYRASPVDNNL